MAGTPQTLELYCHTFQLPQVNSYQPSTSHAGKGRLPGTPPRSPHGSSTHKRAHRRHHNACELAASVQVLTAYSCLAGAHLVLVLAAQLQQAAAICRHHAALVEELCQCVT